MSAFSAYKGGCLCYLVSQLILAGASVEDVYVIGGIPLSLGLGCGDMVLTVAVLAIVLTAPLGAFAIDLSYKKLLER